MKLAMAASPSGIRKGKNSSCVSAHKPRICDKVEMSQEETPKRDTQSASLGIIAARRRAGPGRTTRKRGGKSPEPFQPS